MDYLPNLELAADVRAMTTSCDLTDPSVRSPTAVREWRTSSASLRRASEPVVRGLHQVFVFRGYSDVEKMVEQNPHFVPLLLEARQHVERVFGSGPPLVLEVVQNPEAVDVSPELFVYVQTRLEVAAARQKLEQLDEEWWLDALPRAEGRVSIALEYV